MKDEWASRPFESCIEQIADTTKIQRKDFLSEGKYPIISQEAEFIHGHWNNEADAFRTARPVILFSDHTQILKYVDFDFVLGADRVKILQPHAFLDTKFFYYQLQNIGFPALGYARHYRLLKEIEVWFPPLLEQQRIVALLDDIFAGFATAKANTERNLQSALEVFKSHLQSLFNQRGEEWVETTLDKISTNLDSRRIPITKSARSSGEYPYYGAPGIVDYVADYIFEGDNLLVPEDGANLLARSTPIAFSVSGRYWVNNHAHILHFDDMATQRYVEFYFESVKLDECITGAAQPKLNQKSLTAIPIPIPEAIEEQAKIVSNIEGLQNEIQRLTNIYEHKLAALEDLKKSLLHQAFNGEL